MFTIIIPINVDNYPFIVNYLEKPSSKKIMQLWENAEQFKLSPENIIFFNTLKKIDYFFSVIYNVSSICSILLIVGYPVSIVTYISWFCLEHRCIKRWEIFKDYFKTFAILFPTSLAPMKLSSRQWDWSRSLLRDFLESSCFPARW